MTVDCAICLQQINGRDWVELDDGTIVHASDCEPVVPPARSLPKRKPAKSLPKRKPATSLRKPATTKQPAARTKSPQKQKGSQANGKQGVGVAELAKQLHMDPKALRALLRKRGDIKPPGKGAQYSWPSMKHPEVKRIIKAVSSMGK